MNTHDDHLFWSDDGLSDDQCNSGNPRMDMIIAMCAPFVLRLLINLILAMWERVNHSWHHSQVVALDPATIRPGHVLVGKKEKDMTADIICQLEDRFRTKLDHAQISCVEETMNGTNGPSSSSAGDWKLTRFQLEQMVVQHKQLDHVMQAMSKKKGPSKIASTSSSFTPADYDLAIIGGGVVGVQAALAAASLSKKVCLIDACKESGVFRDGEKDLSLGAPTGLFSKVLRDTSKRTKVSWLRGMGLRDDSIWKEIVSSCNDLASANANDVIKQLEDARVDHIKGLASFAHDGRSLVVSKADTCSIMETISAHKILIATGSRAHRPKGVPFDGKRIFDSDSINQLGYLPRSIAISGGGIIAVEYANIFRNLGADVTLIIRDQNPRNALTKIGLDADIAETLVADMVCRGIQIETGAQVGRFEVVPSNDEQDPIHIQLEAEGGGPRPPGQSTELNVHVYLAAVGRKSNTGKLNLGAAGIELDKRGGGIVVNSSMCTSGKSGNVYAAGDVVGRPFLASTGTAQAIAAVEAMFGKSPQTPGENAAQVNACFDPKSLVSNPFAVPCGIWSNPEAAYFGLSLQQTKESGIDASEGVAFYKECLRGRVFSPNGLLKLVFSKQTGRILGVHICGDHACELIHYGMELVMGERTLTDLTSRLYTAVTFHELYRLAAEDGIDPATAATTRGGGQKPTTATTPVQRIPQTKKVTDEEWEILSV